jgi:hypothetical protein
MFEYHAGKAYSRVGIWQHDGVFSETAAGLATR